MAEIPPYYRSYMAEIPPIRVKVYPINQSSKFNDHSKMLCINTYKHKQIQKRKYHCDAF